MLYLRNVAAVEAVEFTSEILAVLNGCPGFCLIDDSSRHRHGNFHDRILDAFGDLKCRAWESNILEITVEGSVLLLLHKLNLSVTINSDEVHCSVSIFEPVARDRDP